MLTICISSQTRRNGLETE